MAFNAGFQKTAGPVGAALGAATKPARWVAGKAIKYMGGPAGALMNVGGALVEGVQGMGKMTAAGQR